MLLNCTNYLTGMFEFCICFSCILSSSALVITVSESGKACRYSLWAVSDRSYGGLSFTSTDVGNVLAASGMSHKKNQ